MRHVAGRCGFSPAQLVAIVLEVLAVQLPVTLKHLSVTTAARWKASGLKRQQGVSSSVSSECKGGEGTR